MLSTGKISMELKRAVLKNIAKNLTLHYCTAQVGRQGFFSCSHHKPTWCFPKAFAGQRDVNKAVALASADKNLQLL